METKLHEAGGGREEQTLSHAGGGCVCEGGYTSPGLLFGEQFGSRDISPADNQNPVKSDFSSKDIYYLM